MQVHHLLVNKVPTGIKIEVTGSFSRKLMGWMGRKKIPEKGLLLYSCNSIHTLFMRFPIDAVFIDSKNQVVKIVHNTVPWKIIPPVRAAINVLELPSGCARDLSLKEGDVLTFAEEEPFN